MMSLFRFELRKMLFHKKTVILLICLFVLYSLIGFATSLFMIGSGSSYRTYEELAAAFEGPLDKKKTEQSKKVYEEMNTRYGTDP